MVDVYPLLLPKLHKTDRNVKCSLILAIQITVPLKIEKNLKDMFANLVGSFPKELRLLFIYLFCKSIK